ncbi:hypothetical protein AOLI_G00295790 [Acnodon oligacanthus]
MHCSPNLQLKIQLKDGPGRPMKEKSDPLQNRIFGFVNAVSPVSNDQQNLLAFRFSALNPVVDPWVFIIFRKSVFQNVRAFFCCHFRRAAVKATPHSGLSFPLQSAGPANSAALQSKTYLNIPQ